MAAPETKPRVGGAGAAKTAVAFDAVLGLGSNIGSKRANISRAISKLVRQDDIHVIRRSRDYRSAPWGRPDQDWFVNACIAVETKLAPHELLARCQEVERDMGRVRAEHWGPRVIDVDILLMPGIAVDEPKLKIPHPLIRQRAFVLVPLVEIAPDAVIEGRTVRDWLGEIDASDVMPL